MLQPDCEPIMQTIQSLEQQALEIDNRIGTLVAESMRLNPLQFIVSQRKIDHLISAKHALQDEWDNAMNEFAICRWDYAVYHHFDRSL